MIIEDTILHHGAENLLFTDPGAHKSVEDFMNDPTHRRDWRIVREMEKFIMTWNPSGFLQKIQHPARKADTGELMFDRETRDGLYNYHHQWWHWSCSCWPMCSCNRAVTKHRTNHRSGIQGKSSRHSISSVRWQRAPSGHAGSVCIWQSTPPARTQSARMDHAIRL